MTLILSLIEELIISGYYESYTEKDFRSQRKEWRTTPLFLLRQLNRPTYTVKISLKASEEELKEVFSLWFADLSHFDLSLSDQYDKETGTFVQYVKINPNNVFTDGGMISNGTWRSVYDTYIRTDEYCRIGINADGKILFITPLEEDTHTHAFGEWIDKPQTKERVRYCTRCGEAETEVADVDPEPTSHVVFSANKTAAETLTEQWKTAKILKTDGTPLKETELVGSGMVIMNDHGGTATIIVKGDNDSDGRITASDARLALRQAVGLESFNEWQMAASLVGEGDTVTAAQARLILRAAVGLETFN